MAYKWELPLEVVFSACTLFLFLLDILRMKTSSFHHLCQRSRLSPSCRRGRTGAWTRPWTNSAKRPGSVWWQRSARRQYDRTPPRKAPTALKSTSPRLRPASDESELAQIIEGKSLKLTSDFHWHKHTDKIWDEHTDVQRMHRGRSLIAAQLIDRRNAGITGQIMQITDPAAMGQK